MIAKIVTTAFCLGLPVVAAAAEAVSRSDGAKLYGDADRGRVVVEQWCITCHKVGPVMDDQIPSLAALAANSKTDGAIRAFLMQPHRPMPPLEISSQQIEDIVEYLHSIKQRTP